MSWKGTWPDYENMTVKDTNKLLRKLKSGISRPQNRTPIATEMFLPNHSGDHSRGKVNSTPTQDLSIVNKKYVDDQIAASGVSIGTVGQIPFSNAAGDDFDYAGNISFNNGSLALTFTGYIAGDWLPETTETYYLGSESRLWFEVQGLTVRANVLKVKGGSYFTIFEGANQAANITYTLPAAAGAAGTVLTDSAGDGILSWEEAATGASFGTSTQIPYMNGTDDDFIYTSNFTYSGSLFSVTDGALLFSGTTGATPASGAGTRLMWIPSKSSFRAGQVAAAGTEWNDANIATSTVAFGRSTKASADYSVAFGNYTQATGVGSVVFGDSSYATNNYAVAFGANAGATGLYAFSSGLGPIASGSYSIAMGIQTRATTTSSVAMGYYSKTEGRYAFAAGFYAYAYGDAAFAVGKTDNNNYTTMGAFGNGAICLGHATSGNTHRALNAYSIAIGEDVNANANYAAGIGKSFTNATGSSLAIGYGQIDLLVKSGQVQLPADNDTLYFGAGQDASITYDGTDLLLKADVVGSGAVNVQSDQVFVGSGTGLPYGQIYEEDGSSTLDLAAQDTYYQITAFSANGESNLTTPDHTNDHITISKTGIYLVTTNISIQAAQSNEYDFHVQKNNGATDFPCTSLHIDTAVANKTISSSSTGIVSLTANDTLELWVKRLDGGAVSKTITIINASLTVTQIGG